MQDLMPIKMAFAVPSKFKSSFSDLYCDPGERAIQNCIDNMISPRYIESHSQYSCVGSIHDVGDLGLSQFFVL